MEVSLIQRVLPCYIRCHYFLTILFSRDWLSHSSTLSFLEGRHSHSFATFIMWIGLASQIAYLHFYGLAQLPN